VDLFAVADGDMRSEKGTLVESFRSQGGANCCAAWVFRWCRAVRKLHGSFRDVDTDLAHVTSLCFLLLS